MPNRSYSSPWRIRKRQDSRQLLRSRESEQLQFVNQIGLLYIAFPSLLRYKFIGLRKRPSSSIGG
ncbi:MAG: hypothetical protein VKL59_05200 [Nostocaceae cyanobacterium]|nr:hypothetical protein [Nostocaceae cyanobacterium]